MSEGPRLPFEPAPVVAARSILAGERPPIYCDAYLPRGNERGHVRRSEEFSAYWRPQQWWEEVRGFDRWKQCTRPSAFPKDSPELNWALVRGEVRALQEHWAEALHNALCLLRKLAESEKADSDVSRLLPGLDNERLRLRMVLAVHKELREILAEWDYLAASNTPVMSPEAKKPEWIRQVEALEAESHGY